MTYAKVLTTRVTGVSPQSGVPGQNTDESTDDEEEASLSTPIQRCIVISTQN